MSFSGLKLVKKDYKRFISLQDRTIATYTNHQKGIIYTVDDTDDDVTAIEYLPKAKDCKNSFRHTNRLMMKTTRSLLMLPPLIVAFYSGANAQDWRKIAPLTSTRSEVEALLGTAKDGYSAIYQLEEGSLFIEYSTGLYRPERKGGWNVPENVVVSMSFSPKHKGRIASLKLDPKKFRKENGKHVGGVTYYINDDEGITYEVQSGRVDSIEYGPGKRYDHLYCGDAADQKVPPH